MNKKLTLLALAACATLAGCADDSAGSAGVPVQRCQNEGESYCGESNNVFTCRMGVLEENSCGSNNICHNGKCTSRCTPGQFKNECRDGAMWSCTPDERNSAVGYVEAHVCDPGNVCDPKLNICRDVDMLDCDTNYRATCRDDHSLTKCIAGAVVRESCQSDYVCRNGLCMPPTACDPSTFVPFCSDSMTYAVCNNGTVSYLSCEGNTTCNAGVCTGQCEADYKGCSDDGFTRLYCENGVVKSSPCLGGQPCVDGECKPAVECEAETFMPVCEDGKAKKCDINGKIVLEICQNGTECYNGTCVTDGPCTPETFKPVCVDSTTVQVCGENGLKAFTACDNGYVCEGGICQNFPTNCTTGEVACMNGSVARECKDGAWHARYCDIPNEGCVAGNCVKITEAEKCNESEPAKCVGNEVVACEHGYVVKTTCGSNQRCDSGACLDNIVEGGNCDPATFKSQCMDNKNTAICANGKVTLVACGDGSCQNGECVAPPCNPASYAPTCKSDLLITVCQNGKVDQENCPENTHCSNGTCVSNSAPGEKCSAKSFTPVCDSSNTLISCENSVVTKTTCPNDKPLCLNGSCVKTECDPATYGTQCKDDGKTPLWCNGGFIQELSACLASAPVCLNGKCVECDETKTPPTCQGSAYSLVCQNSHKYKLIPCDYNESCIEGKGCINKCGENFKNHCDDQGRMVYCNDKGEVVTSSCSYNEQCVNGACESIYGTPCLPATYQNKCIEENGQPIAQICDEDTKTVVFRNCSAQNRFCGSINGKTNCYINCTAEDMQHDYTWCDVVNGKNYVGKCEPGKDYKGGDRYGVFRRHAFCNNNNSVSCRNASNGHVVFDYLNCGLMGGSNKTCTSNTCAFASCNAPAAACNNNFATNCIWDPSHNDGDGGYVMTTMNCGDVKGSCAVLNPDGITRALCDASFTDANSRTWRSLGTCDGKVLYRLYWGESANKPIISNIVCNTACVSKTENGVSYAYCE